MKIIHYLYTYKNNGNQIEEMKSRWDFEINDWIPVYQLANTYDDSENIIEGVKYNWNEVRDDWEGEYKYIKSYNDIGNAIEEIQYRWLFSNGEWELESRFVNSYDADGNETGFIRYAIDLETGEWKYSQRMAYYRSELAASISDYFFDQNLIVYPNPATDYTIITIIEAAQIHKIELIDITGRTVRSYKNISSNSLIIHRGNLSSNIYFIRLNFDNNIIKELIFR